MSTWVGLSVEYAVSGMEEDFIVLNVRTYSYYAQLVTKCIYYTMIDNQLSSDVEIEQIYNTSIELYLRCKGTWK